MSRSYLKENERSLGKMAESAPLYDWLKLLMSLAKGHVKIAGTNVVWLMNETSHQYSRRDYVVRNACYNCHNIM